MKVRFTVLLALVTFAGTGQDKTFTNSIGMEFVLIQPGTMTVGKFEPTVDRPDDPNDRLPDSLYIKAEKLAKAAYMPGFEVTFNKPYYIGKFEVTQAQWTKVMGTNPSVFTASKVSDDVNNHPVENVTWKDVQQFIKTLNKLDKEHTYRLPTECCFIRTNNHCYRFKKTECMGIIRYAWECLGMGSRCVQRKNLCRPCSSYKR
jgi:formylglycine-generating enzyme